MKTNYLFSRITITAILLLSTFATYAQRLEVVSNNRSNLELSLKIDEFSLESSSKSGIEGQNIVLNGIFLPNQAGMPDLPIVSSYVAIPRGADVVLNIKNQVTETVSGVELMPAPELPLDDDNSPMRYYRDEQVYSTNALYPANPIFASEPTKIRDVDVVLVSVSPFQYNPVTKELVVTRQLDLEVAFEGGNGTFGGDPRYRSTAWDHIIRDMVINESILPDANYQQFIQEAVQRRDTGYEYLIITPDNPDFVQLADSIKTFRTQQGILTGVVTVTECGGNDQNAIRNYIMNAYNNWDIPVSAVLFLGDHNADGTHGIVSYTMNNHPGSGYNPYISDNKYADVNNDHLPDVVLGRITGRNYNEMYHMINKDLQYERFPSTNPDFYDKPITAMGFQLERWFQLCSEVVNGFWEHELGKHPVRINAIYEGTPGNSWSSAQNTSTIVNYFGPNGTGYIPQNMSHLHDWNGTWQDINNNINAGAFMIQHRDHGAEELWGEPRYSITHINQLTNPDLTYVMSNNCLTGRFNYGGVNGTCFAEAFHRHQYGALGLVAATQVSYSFVNDIYVWGVYDNMWPEFMPTFGTHNPTNFILPAYGNVAGKYFLQQSSWTGSSVKEITYYLFHHHGDVYMNLYTEMPQTLDVTMIPVITQGDTQFELTATEGATICITSNGTIAALATATGQPQSIAITPQFVGNDLLLTVTKQNYYRYTHSISVAPNEGPYLILNSFVINDNDSNGQVDFNENISLDVAIHNVGFADIQNVNAVLTSESPYVDITSASTTYESININEIVTKNNAFAIKISDDVPDQTKITLLLTMSTDSYSFTDEFTLTVNAPVFKVTNLSIKNADGDPTDRLHVGETSQLTFTVNNQGHSNSNAVNHHLLLDAPIFDYQQQTITTEGINVDGSTDVTFVVTVSNSAPNGAIIDNYMTVTSNGYQEVYQSEIPLGNSVENFENETLSSLYQWSNSGSSKWFRDDTDPYEGQYCYTGASSETGVTSKLGVGVNVELEDIVSFWYRGSVNATDEFVFHLNAESYPLTGGPEWHYFELPIKTGMNLLRWNFARNSHADEGSASIDLLKLPPIHMVITDVEEVTDIENNIFVYPNPGNNELNIINSRDDVTKLQIFDFQGRMILEKEIHSGIMTINTENWASGLYFWKVGNETGKWIKSR